MIFLALLMGFGVGQVVHHQSDYCECFRTRFFGHYCQSIKGEKLQGSCELAVKK